MDITDETMDSSLSSVMDDDIKPDSSETKKDEELTKSNNSPSLLEMIKSRPKRPKTKVPTRARSKPLPISVEDKSIKSSESRSTGGQLDTGLDTFFQRTSLVLKRRAFGENCRYGVSITGRPSVKSMEQHQKLLSSLKKPENLEEKSKENEEPKKEDNGHHHGSHDNDNESESSKSRLCPLAERIARSRSSPNLIDPRKMLPGDPRVHLSMIKELRSRQKSGESSSNESTSSSLLSELKAKNRKSLDAVKPSLPIKREVASTVGDGLAKKDSKPPMPILKPIPPPPLPTAESQPGHFFNIKLRETKSGASSRNFGKIIKSHTRASFPLPETKSETEAKEEASQDKKKDDTRRNFSKSETILPAANTTSESECDNDGRKDSSSEESSSSSEDEKDGQKS